MRREARASCSDASEDWIVASKSFKMASLSKCLSDRIRRGSIAPSSDDVKAHGAQLCRLGSFTPVRIAEFPTLDGAQNAGFWRFASKTHPGGCSAAMSSSRGLYHPRPARPFLEPLMRSDSETHDDEISRASRFATRVQVTMALLQHTLTRRRRALSPPRHPPCVGVGLQRLRRAGATSSAFAFVRSSLDSSSRARSRIKCSSLFPNELIRRIKGRPLRLSQNFKTNSDG